MAADFNLPTVSGEYTAIPGEIRDNFAAAVTMHETDASTNKPTGAKQITATGAITRWNGSTWVSIADPSGHAASTSNPHSVTASQAGAPALAHTHTGTTDGSKLAQANTHESADTDTATSAIHHTLGAGANQAAAGDHAHSYSLVAQGYGQGSAGDTAVTSIEASLTATNIASTTAQPYSCTNFHAFAREGADIYTLTGTITIAAGSNDVLIQGIVTNPEDASNSALYIQAVLSAQRGSTSYAYGTATGAGSFRSIRIGVKKGASDDEVYVVIDDSGTTTWDELVILVNAFTLKVT